MYLTLETEITNTHTQVAKTHKLKSYKPQTKQSIKKAAKGKTYVHL